MGISLQTLFTMEFQITKMDWLQLTHSKDTFFH